MKFRIWHLLLLVSVAAISIHFLNEASYSSVKMKVAGVLELPDPSYPLLSTMEGDYCVLLDFPTARPSASAFASARYGRSTTFNSTIAEDNWATLNGECFEIRYRAKDFLWFKRRSIAETMDQRFSTVRWSSIPSAWEPAG